MASGKREAEESVKPSKVSSSSSMGMTETSTRRVTRSVTAAAVVPASSSVASLAEPAKKVNKRKPKSVLDSQRSEKNVKIVDGGSKSVVIENPANNVKNFSEEIDSKEKQEEVIDSTKTIIVEHCKQCNSFKTRALLVQSRLEESVPNLKVVLNPEKPRRGCFEIRQEGGMKFVSLLDMKRPFKDMKALDMDEVIATIIEKIKS